MKTNTFIKWIALCFTLSGALCTSFKIMPLNVYLLNVGALLYMIWGIRIKEVNIAIVNGGLLLIYLTGVAMHHGLIDSFLGYLKSVCV
jgi:hypothetical protein